MSAGEFRVFAPFFWNAKDKVQRSRNRNEESSDYKLNRLASKTFLNRAIIHCPDLAVLEDIIDAYAHAFPAAFTEAWVGPLIELQPIHTAVRAKRLDVVRLLVGKGLAPASTDGLFCFSFVRVDWAADYNLASRNGWGAGQDATPFHIALSKADEAMCIALLADDGSQSRLGQIPANDEVDREDERLAHYLAAAEYYGMHQLIPALLNHWKRVGPVNVYSLRRILYLSMELRSERLTRESEISVRRRLLASEVDETKSTIHHLLDFGDERWDGALLFAALRRYEKEMMIILRHQGSKGTINVDELKATLIHVARATDQRWDVIYQMWPYCEPWLHRKDRSAEDNLQGVAQCMSECLKATIYTADQAFNTASTRHRKASLKASLHLLQNGVKPERCHLQAAIKAWDHVILSELISRGNFDLQAKVDCFEGLTPFEYALQLWDSKVGASSPRTMAYPDRPDMTILLKLVYYGGLSDEVSKETRDIARFLFEIDFGGLAKTSDWHERGMQILENSVHPDAWNREALIDATVPPVDRLTTFHLIVRKQFGLDKDAVTPCKSSKVKPWFSWGDDYDGYISDYV